MTPGTFLRTARETAGLTVECVALRTETEPAVSAHQRAEWLEMIECDAAPVSIATACALYGVYGKAGYWFDTVALEREIERYRDWHAADAPPFRAAHAAVAPLGAAA